MSADAWILLIVSATLIWGGLGVSVVALARHREAPAVPGEHEEES